MNNQREESELRAAIQFSVIQICAQEEMHTKTKITPQAISALSELTYLYATISLRNDLDVFSIHAGRRKTIDVADVKLVARKNPDNLLDKLNQYAQELQNAATSSKSRKKEIMVDLDKECSSSSSEDGILGIPNKKTADKHFPPPTDSSVSSTEDEVFKMTARPRAKTKQAIDMDDSSDSSIEKSQLHSRTSTFQPPYSAGGSRIKDILEQLSQDSIEWRNDTLMEE